MFKYVYNLMIAAALLVLGSSLLAGSVQVRVNDQIKCDSKVVTIGDIAWINAADEKMKDRLTNMVVADKDASTNQLLISSFDISRCLSKAGINPATVDIYGSLECRVIFNGPASTVDIAQHVEPVVETLAIDIQNSIRAALDLEVANTTGYDLDRLVIDWDVKDDELLNRAMDNSRYEIKAQRSVSLGNIRFMVTDRNPSMPENVLPQHEKFYNKPKVHYINGQVQYLSEYVVAACDMKVGEVISRADVKMVPQLVCSVSQVGVSSLDAVVGKELTRSVQAEQVIKTNMVKRLMLVERNRPVYIRYNSSAISITTKGLAMEDGGMNDVIPIKVSHQKAADKRPVSQVLYCKVIAPGEAVMVDEDLFGNTSAEFANAGWENK